MQANLRFARDRITGSASLVERSWERILRYFTVNELAVAAAVLLWVTMSLTALVRYRPTLRPVLRPYILAGAALLFANIAWLAFAYSLSEQKIAIAADRQVVVHLGPLAESQAAYTVPDGTELRVEAQRENWFQVLDRSSRSGWVEAGNVLTVP